MLAGRLLRDGVLRQSATSSNDGPAPPPRAPPWSRRCSPSWTGARAGGRGVPASAPEEVDYGPLLRAPEETGPADADAVRRHGRAMLAVLEGLR